jgi:hypothetical protein
VTVHSVQCNNQARVLQGNRLILKAHGSKLIYLETPINSPQKREFYTFINIIHPITAILTILIL